MHRKCTGPVRKLPVDPSRQARFLRGGTILPILEAKLIFMSLELPIASNPITGSFNNLYNELKDELVRFGTEMEYCFTIITHPVNNFLKDLSQIERDFMMELGTETVVVQPRPTGKIIPIDEALKGSMEENY